MAHLSLLKTSKVKSNNHNQKSISQSINMTTNPTITISARAYCKIILHAAKYPYCSINGVLLAKTSSLKSAEIEFVDAIPLFHIALNLTPMAEVALMQIDELAVEEDLTIAGYYTALENIQDNSFEKVHNRICDKIAANCSTSYLVVVNNAKLSLNMDNIALKVAQCNDGNYKSCDIQRVCLKPDNTLDICMVLLDQDAYTDLFDFDNHLDNIVLDWKNPLLNRKIEQLCHVHNE